jgi:DNA polymerase elongation subunit (family B)
VQDCELCNRLAAKLEILANNAGMANVCLVPLSFIFMRGQGIKIFSLVAKRCRDDGFLVPTRYQAPRPGDRGYVAGGGGEDEEEEGYEGAIVLEPEVGMYLEQPVSVLDYNSLYPSSMISHNLSHDSLVVDDAYDRLPGLEYSEVVYDRYEGKGDEKRVVGQQVQAASWGHNVRCRRERRARASPSLSPSPHVGDPTLRRGVCSFSSAHEPLPETHGDLPETPGDPSPGVSVHLREYPCASRRSIQ